MKDLYCSYYTNSKDITSYMVEKLHIVEKDRILEPSAGEGIFIDKVLEKNRMVQIDALDINREAIAVLKKKYENNDAVVVRETDTLLDEQLDAYSFSPLWLKESNPLYERQRDLLGDAGGYYSKIIGNPPYGAWQDYEKRNILKHKFAGHYVKETYSLFLLRCISVLKSHGILSFIIPDTYLFLNVYSRLREILFTNTKIDEILIFPSKFFPGVRFGYSKLSIITLARWEKKEAVNHVFRVVQGFHSPSEIGMLLGKNDTFPKHLQVSYFKQKDILNHEQCRMILADKKTLSLLSKPSQKLGDVADVVTGFYTGDNLRFIRTASKDVKGVKNYRVVEQDKVFRCTSLYGISNVQEGYISYIKSASQRRYVRQKDEWFVRWDMKTIEFYNSNKKSRFQNSSFYFKTGIGMPMVKSRRIHAFLMSNHVFDQSIVGIFPKDTAKLYYLLALMNSDVINNLIYAVNPSANNSANYIKGLPYIEPDENVFIQINNKVQELIDLEKVENYEKADDLHKELNGMIGQIYF